MGKITIIAQQKANNPPTVNAGTDQSINLPDTSVSLSATAGDSDGIIVSVQWTKLAGGTAIITSPSTLATTVTGLQVGSYTFQVKVFDNEGDSATDTVTIVVGSYQALPFKWVGSDPECIATAPSTGRKNLRLQDNEETYTGGSLIANIQVIDNSDSSRVLDEYNGHGEMYNFSVLDNAGTFSIKVINLSGTVPMYVQISGNSYLHQVQIEMGEDYTFGPINKAGADLIFMDVSDII